MRILHVTPGYHPDLGGVERHVQDVSEAMARLGHQVVVVTMTQDARLPRHEVLAGVEIRRLAAIGPRNYQLPLGLLRYLRQQRFDIVHAHNYHALPMLLAAMVCGTRGVVSPYYHGRGHSRSADVLHQIYRPLGRAALRRATGVVCLSRGEADLVARRLGVAPASITVVPSILDLPSETEVPDPQLRANRLILRLAIVGDGPERPRLERLIAAQGLAERVLLLGRVSDGDLARWYARAGIVVALSEAESFGRTIVEALAHGCQVVCSDIPAFREFAAAYPAAVALVAPTASSQGIATLIAAATTRPQSSLDLQRYSWRSVAAELLRVYAGCRQPTTDDRRPTTDDGQSLISHLFKTSVR
jgi:glycosyltransferase involved in cell wall biosynthesis